MLQLSAYRASFADKLSQKDQLGGDIPLTCLVRGIDVVFRVDIWDVLEVDISNGVSFDRVGDVRLAVRSTARVAVRVVFTYFYMKR